MKLRKLLIVACALLMLMGCTGKTTKKEEKVHVTMYLWDKSLSRNLTPWLQEIIILIFITIIICRILLPADVFRLTMQLICPIC